MIEIARTLAVAVQARDADAVRRAVEDVLSRDEFRRLASGPREKTWIQRVLHAIEEWLEKAFGLGAGMGGPWLVRVLWILVVVALLWLLVAFVRRRMGRERAPEVVDVARVRAERVRELLARSRAARERGAYAEALRLAFWALVIGLSERGDLEYRDAWTNRELVERGRPRQDVARVLAALVPELDAKSFGHEEAFASDVDRVEALCREHLRGVA